MEITKHEGWSDERTTELLVASDFEEGTVCRDNTGVWYIRMAKEISHDPPVYEAYWLTFDDTEARKLKRAINYLLPKSKQDTGSKGAI